MSLSFSNLVALLIWMPIGMGVWRFRDLERPFRIFLAYLILCAGVDHSAMFIREISMRNKIQDSFSLISSILLILMIRGLDTEKRHRFWYQGITLAMICIMLIDHFCRPIDQPKIPWGYLTCEMIVTLHAMNLLTRALTFGNVCWYKQPRILIFIPLMINFLYMTVLMLLMSILYRPETKSFFLEIYQTINILNIIKYISYTLAFLWIPRMEKFL